MRARFRRRPWTIQGRRNGWAAPQYADYGGCRPEGRLSRRDRARRAVPVGHDPRRGSAVPLAVAALVATPVGGGAARADPVFGVAALRVRVVHGAAHLGEPG